MLMNQHCHTGHQLSNHSSKKLFSQRFHMAKSFPYTIGGAFEKVDFSTVID